MKLQNNTVIVALSVFMLSTLSLLLLSDYISPKTREISSITSLDIDSQVQIKGLVTLVDHRESFTIIKLQDSTGTIDTIMFKPQKAIEEGSNLVISGKISLYKNKPQIVANSVSLPIS